MYLRVILRSVFIDSLGLIVSSHDLWPVLHFIEPCVSVVPFCAGGFVLFSRCVTSRGVFVKIKLVLWLRVPVVDSTQSLWALLRNSVFCVCCFIANKWRRGWIQRECYCCITSIYATFCQCLILCSSDSEGDVSFDLISVPTFLFMIINLLHPKSTHFILQETWAKSYWLFSLRRVEFSCCMCHISVQWLLSCDRRAVYLKHFNNIKQRKSCNKFFYNKATRICHVWSWDSINRWNRSHKENCLLCLSVCDLK